MYTYDAQGQVINMTASSDDVQLVCEIQYKNLKTQAVPCVSDSECVHNESCRPVPNGSIGTRNVCLQNGTSLYNYKNVVRYA